MEKDKPHGMTGKKNAAKQNRKESRTLCFRCSPEFHAMVKGEIPNVSEWLLKLAKGDLARKSQSS